jgi:hypothetical protein
LYFDRTQSQNDDSTAASALQRPVTPPSISAVFAAATENGTWIGGIGHLGIWRNDTLRYSGGAAFTSLDLTFYGGGKFPALEHGIDYNIEGWGIFQQLLWRLGGSDFWLGPQLLYFDATTKLEQQSTSSTFDDLNADVITKGAGVEFNYDSRDNIFTPNRGSQYEWHVRDQWGEFHGDFNYLDVAGKNRWYLNPSLRWTIGLRLDMNYVSGEVPFYARPSITQRGIPRVRYQGDAVVSAEVEARFGFDARWFGVAFVGDGRAANSSSDIGSADDRFAGGIGFRYLLARVLRLQVGVDVARGPEEWAVYLQIGNGWSF